jgi:hypothetical protein
MVGGGGGLYQADHYMSAWTKRCIRQVRVVGEGAQGGGWERGSVSSRPLYVCVDQDMYTIGEGGVGERVCIQQITVCQLGPRDV